MLDATQHTQHLPHLSDVQNAAAPKGLARFADILRPLRRELLLAVFVSRGKVEAVQVSSSNQPDWTAFPVRAIVTSALVLNCSSLVLVHNHPSGMANPSQDDIHHTRQLARALLPLGIQLDDHIIVAGGGQFSFREAGLI